MQQFFSLLSRRLFTAQHVLGVLRSLSSWWWEGERPKHVEQYINVRIINWKIVASGWWSIWICYKRSFTVRLSYLWTYCFVCVIKDSRILVASVMREVPDSLRFLPKSDREGSSDVDSVTSHMSLIGPIYVLFLRLSQFTVMADVYWSVEQSFALICEVEIF